MASTAQQATQTGNGGGYVNGYNRTYASAVPAGTFLWFALSSGAADTSSLSDQLNGAWSAGPVIALTSQRQIRIYYVESSAAGTPQVSVQMGANQYADTAFAMGARSGMFSGTKYDKNATATSSGTTHAVGPTTTLAQADEWILAAFALDSAVPGVTGDAGFNAGTTVAAFDNWTGLFFQEKSVASTSAISATITTSGGRQVASAIATFREAPAGTTQDKTITTKARIFGILDKTIGAKANLISAVVPVDRTITTKARITAPLDKTIATRAKITNFGTQTITAKANLILTPVAVTDVIVEKDNNKALISWNDTASSYATSYKVQRATTSGGTYTTVGTPSIAEYLDTTVTNGNTYYYKVIGVNAAGTEGPASSIVSVTPTARPSAPADKWYQYGSAPVGVSQTNIRTFTRTHYDNWVTYTFTKSGATQSGKGAWRVWAPDQTFYSPTGNGQYYATVSEGIGYGMFVCAYMSRWSNPMYDINAKKFFHGFYYYFKENTNVRGFMNWHMNPDNTPNDTGGATDGDFDMAMGLCLMHFFHGSSGPINYKAEAITLINAMRDYEFVPSNHATAAWRGLMMNGDQWGVDTDQYMPDYFSPAWMRVFEEITGDTYWSTLINKNYELAVDYFYTNTAYGLIPDKNLRSGAQVDAGSYKYGYNSIRRPWRLTPDYLWFGDTRAYNSMRRMALDTESRFSGVPANAKAEPALDWSSFGNYINQTFLSGYGVAGLTNVDTADWSGAIMGWLNDNAANEASYFGASLGMLGLLAASGEMVQPFYDRSIGAKAHIVASLDKTITAKARITATSDKTITAKGRLQKERNSDALPLYGLLFDGVDDHILTTGPDYLNPDEITFVFKHIPTGTGSRAIITYAGHLIQANGTSIDFWVNTANQSVSKARVNAGVEETVVVKLSFLTNTTECFVNGVSLGTNVITVTKNSATFNTIQIGQYNGNSRRYQGTLKDLQVYHSWLSTQDTAAVSTDGVGVVAVPQKHWNFDEGVDAIAYNIIGNGHNGVIDGATWVSDGTKPALTAKARIAKNVDPTITTKARIAKNIDATLTTKARITAALDKTLQTRARIIKAFDTTITTKARIAKIVDPTITTKARVAKEIDQTIGAKAFIIGVGDQHIGARARITQFGKRSTNYITNGEFESNITGWSPYAGDPEITLAWENNAANARKGNGSLKLAATASGYQGFSGGANTSITG